ncbi:AraC family transcriptional regulator [Providencia stuartii]|uniref:AraC family transcriptional regulator n=1 Tax=Providencia stuartii TaxID=588 RepID=UPI0018C4BCC9|nr:AraC family transcriptional regulator [Providencia stuartii]MBG5920538.1 AraC family transcriptional regulator [Providencia stuartii]
MIDTNIAALLENKECCFSLQDKLVLAVPHSAEMGISFNSSYSGKRINIEEQSLFFCSQLEFDSIISRKDWLIYSLELSEVVEILAVIDSAMKQSFLLEKEMMEPGNRNSDVIFISNDYIYDLTIKDIVIGLIIQQQPEFNLWCNILRRYEAYGIMRFLLSAAEKDKNANINQLCKQYGISASYFRQLYRENFNKTAKRKIMSVRMASAILKLIESDNSILDIGLEAGYCSASHFTNDIKKELGLTPSDIRHLGVKLYEK